MDVELFDFYYKGGLFKFSYCIDECHEMWFKAKEFTIYLKFSDHVKAIHEHVQREDKILGKNLEINSKFDKSTIFINLTGLNSLIDKSQQDDAVEFKHWINNEMVPRFAGEFEY